MLFLSMLFLDIMIFSLLNHPISDGVHGIVGYCPAQNDLGQVMFAIVHARPARKHGPQPGQRFDGPYIAALGQGQPGHCRDEGMA